MAAPYIQIRPMCVTDADLESAKAQLQTYIQRIDAAILKRDTDLASRRPISHERLEILRRYIADCKQYDEDYRAFTAARDDCCVKELQTQLSSIKRRRTMRLKELNCITDRSSRAYRRATLDIEEYDEQIADAQKKLDDAKAALTHLVEPTFPSYIKATYYDGCSCSGSCECIPLSWCYSGSVPSHTLYSIHRIADIDDILESLSNPSDPMFLSWTWEDSDTLSITLQSRLRLRIQW